MLEVIYLGTGAAIPSRGRDNTSLAIDDGETVTLIDTSGSPLKRLAEAGIAGDRLARVIITHEHLDHTFGFPSLLQSLWLSGRRAPLAVYALPAVWRVLDGLMNLYHLGSWPNAFTIERHPIEAGEPPFVETSAMAIRASHGQHSVPSVGLRVETAEASLTYSSDTAPCASIIDLARGSDVLIHESTFLAGDESPAGRFGHSTARQAAEVALEAGAGRLALIHFTPAARDELARLAHAASVVYSGPVDVPGDGDRLRLA
jgi:ribonuclease Z